MIVYDAIGTFVLTPTALILLVSALTPSPPPRPAFGSTEGACLIMAAITGFGAAVCIIHMFGAR